MKFFNKSKDSCPESPVDAYFLFEIKGLCSVALLKFNKGKREQYHTHAFNAWTWFLGGDLTEEDVDGTLLKYARKFKPKFTGRDKNHRVIAKVDSYCFTFRGPWCDYWTETSDDKTKETCFTHGRIVFYELRNFNK